MEKNLKELLEKEQSKMESMSSEGQKFIDEELKRLRSLSQAELDQETKKMGPEGEAIVKQGEEMRARHAQYAADQAKYDKQKILDDAEVALMLANTDAMLAESKNQVAALRKIQLGYESAYKPSASTNSLHGHVNNKILCAQCNEKGYVHIRQVSKKAGVSGGKATAALLTAGLSLFLAGLSRKEKMTEAYCGNCKSQWYF